MNETSKKYRAAIDMIPHDIEVGINTSTAARIAAEAVATLVAAYKLDPDTDTEEDDDAKDH